MIYRNYGMPYMGSKNKIAEQIIDFLPPAEHFYDLFGGGGAMTHCALLSGKYKYVHYNEFEPLVFKAFKMAVNGEFKDEKRWISREDFDRLCSTDPYVALCFSFGNNLDGYCYGKGVEEYKKATHYAVYFNDFSYINSLIPNFDEFSKMIMPLTDEDSRYSALSSQIKCLNPAFDSEIFSNRSDIAKYQLVSGLESYSRLKRLKDLGNLKGMSDNIFFTNGSYECVKIESDSVVYCDPPYVNTSEYLSKFDYDKFYKFAANTDNCFISEYYMPSNFYTVLEIQKQCTFSSTSNNTKTIEKVFCIKPYSNNKLEF